MSKFVKNLITDHLRGRLQGVQDALLVNVVGMDANTNHRLRGVLAGKHIHLLVVNNSLAARATADTPLAGLFAEAAGCGAICWGGDDIVSLAKEITRLIGGEKYKPLEARGGVMDGQRLSGPQVAEVSKWPNRAEQLSLLLGQILSPGANLVSQLTAVGGALASQIEQQGSAQGAAPAEATPSQEQGS
jgi:ribosomal protein L10